MAKQSLIITQLSLPHANPVITQKPLMATARTTRWDSVPITALRHSHLLRELCDCYASRSGEIASCHRAKASFSHVTVLVHRGISSELEPGSFKDLSLC